MLWFIGVWWAGARGVYITPVRTSPGAVGLGFGIPFRQTVSSFSPVLLAALHGWRFIGMSFIMASRKGLLPPTFAWPAGLGDAITALFAPWIAARLARQRAFLASGWLVAWCIFSIVDFLDAIALGILHQIAPDLFHATIDTSLMQEMPFVLIPCFFVPLLGMTSIVLLYQRRELLRGGGSR